MAPSVAFAQQSGGDAGAPAAPPSTPAATPETPAATGDQPAAAAGETTPAAGDATPAAGATPAAAEAEEDADARPAVEMHGAVEAAYSYNLNDPSNGINNNRFYDTRHNLVGLQNAWLTTAWNAGPASGHVELQLGAFTELFWPGERSVEEDLLWRLMQEVTAEVRTPWRPLSIEAGVFNVPFGPEYNVAHKNWNWSTSNLFAAMPYQIAGMRANLDLGHGWTARLGVYNGWDRIVTDNNGDKSVMAAIEYEDPDDDENYFIAEYMVGGERDRGDARGPHARHTFDVYGNWHVAQPFFVRAHVFSAIEPGREGMDGFFGAALFARWDATSWFSVAVRGDVMYGFASGRNFLYADYLDDPTRNTLLGSGTLTLDVHPNRYASIRLEARHDRSDFPLFYSGDVPKTPIDMMTGEGGDDIATESNQTTVLLGLTTWF